MPWDDVMPARFSGATEAAQLASLSEPLLGTPCACPGGLSSPALGSPGVLLWPVYVVGCVAICFGIFARIAAFRRLNLLAADTSLEELDYYKA